MKIFSVLFSVVIFIASCAAQKPTRTDSPGAPITSSGINASEQKQTRIIPGAERINVYLPLIRGKHVDILIFDIQDVGVRFYTIISSLQEYMEAAMENSKPLLILDRPNPNGFYVDGPVLDPKFKSFVGMQPIPIVYGMTIAEYAFMIVGEKWLSEQANQKYAYYLMADNSADTSFHLQVI